MTIELLRECLLWCTIINACLLLVWVVMIIFLHDLIFHFHGKWFNLSVERFDAIHYAGMALFKLSIFMFNLVPYVALTIAG